MLISFSADDREIDHPSTTSGLQTGKDTHLRDPPSPKFDDDFDIFGVDMMPGTGHSSPFIKDEPDDGWFNNQPATMNQQNQNFNLAMENFNGQVLSQSVDPNELQNNYAGQYGYGTNNMSDSFTMGKSMIADDELTALDLNQPKPMSQQTEQGMQGFYHNGNQGGHAAAMQQQQQQQQQQMFSNTPVGDPMQSPFLAGQFNYSNYQPQQMHQQMSPYGGPNRGNAPPLSRETSYMSARQRNSLSHAMERKVSDSRSPMTPRTPAIGGLNLGTPEAGSLPQPIHGSLGHRHQKSLSGQWDSQRGSLDSFAAGSPLNSPAHMNHPQISEILKGNKAGSLPSKVENQYSGGGNQSQEAKRRRRRESHNLVERRRRDNINERIQDLASLVPQHRLEDDKIRKHLSTNSPISPGLVPSGPTGISPPQSSSLLSVQRRAASVGNITIGLPLEDKDKGPNKGDILNGSVAWTRDLIWYMKRQNQQLAQAREYIVSIGGTWPLPAETEDEKRMQTELQDVFDRQPEEPLRYSRYDGSGLRVPQHTNIAGESISGQSGDGALGQQFWDANNGGHGNLSFPKEEDEYNMEMH